MRARALLAVLLVVSSAAVAFGQPAAPAPPPPPPPPALEGTGEIAYVGTTGNTSTQSFGLAGDVTSRPAPWVFRFKTAYVRNESDNVETAESLTALFRASRQLSPRLAAYGQYDYLRNLFAGIEHRNGLEGGLSFLAADTTVHRLRLDAGIGYANERRTLGDDLSTATASLGAGYRLRLSATSEFADEGRFVASLSDGHDWRLENIAALTARLTTLFSLKVSHTVRYVNAPAQTFKTTDTITAVAFVAKFARP